MTAQNSNIQTSFIDKTEFGVLDQNSVRNEFAKYKRLKKANQLDLQVALAKCHSISRDTFIEIMDEKKHFTFDQFFDFKLAVEHYQALEKYA